MICLVDGTKVRTVGENAVRTTNLVPVKCGENRRYQECVVQDSSAANVKANTEYQKPKKKWKSRSGVATGITG